MSKYLSKAGTKRLPLTSKRARKGYYKGNGATKEGHITSKGRFIVDRSKQLELIVPDLTNFKVSNLVIVAFILNVNHFKKHPTLPVVVLIESLCLTAQAVYCIDCAEVSTRKSKDACRLTIGY
jgi:hypothetical protein